jgi:DNA-binding MarR family transcriptional regulator
MIRLLGRSLFPQDKLKEVVMFKKRDPERYITVYNLCNGEHTGKEIADVLQLDQGDLSRVLSDWNELGIVYEVARRGKGKFYKKLYKLEEPRATEGSKEAKPETKSTEL